MATLKIFLNTSKVNGRGEAPLYMRVIQNRKSNYASLGIYLKEKDWDSSKRIVKKAHPNSTRLNNLIATKIAEAQGTLLDFEMKGDSDNSEKLIKAIKGETSLLFFDYSAHFFKISQTKLKLGTIRKMNVAIEKVKKFTSNQNFYLDQLNVIWLNKFEYYLRSELKNGTNTIHTTMKSIRRIINEAIKEEVFPPEKNPFLRYKLKWEQTPKNYLTEEELGKLEKLQLQKGSKKDIHRDMFVFAAYAGGLRISDILMLRWQQYNGERVVVNTHKTGTTVSIKLPPRAIQIIEKYKTEYTVNEDFIFPLLKRFIDYSVEKTLFSWISSHSAYTNADLKDLAKSAGINKKLHFHVSRHTWATRALSKGMRIEYVSRLMGHNSIKTTQVYAKIVNEELDKAMEVFN
ncbi:site-specific integrase [Solitalea sp. MAHUQ-68]|uniref:Site-specific integrase n=1 Tax=Solitalea agri TaxID=2953739 RepID=A0A9X2JCH5_9SPHI|nr:site-specific integrase [Solitalea agri]MCO4293063.1 site-specific integrase [Solitalea agri]